MTDKKRLDPGLVFFLLALFIVTTWFGFSFLSWPSGKGDEPGQYEYIEPDKVDYDSVVTSSSAESLCDENGCDSASRDRKRNEFNKDKRDLNAQEGMWRAANALVFLTLVQMCVVAATLWYLRETYRTQRSELDQARRAADAAEISAKGMCVVKVVKHLNSYSPEFSLPYNPSLHCLEFNIINAGQTIAVIKSIRVGGKNVTSDTEYRIMETESFYEDTSFQAVLLPNEGADETSSAPYHYRLRKEDIPSTSENKSYFAWCEIDYADAFGKIWRANMTFRRTKSTMPHPVIQFGPLSHSEKQIKSEC